MTTKDEQAVFNQINELELKLKNIKLLFEQKSLDHKLLTEQMNKFQWQTGQFQCAAFKIIETLRSLECTFGLNKLKKVMNIIACIEE